LGVAKTPTKKGTTVTNKCQKTMPKTSTGPGLAVPDAVTIAMGEIAEGLLAVAVGAGLQVMASLMEADVAAVCGPRGRHDPGRTAVRHGRERGSVTLGGRRTSVTRPRMRATSGGGEVPVPAYELFSSSEILSRMAMGKMLGGLSSRRYTVGLEPVGEKVERAASATSKSAVSRRFVAMTETALTELLAAPLGSLDLVALMIDGVHFGAHLCVVALGIGIDGTKHPLGLVEGSTENTTVVTDLLTDLRERGLNTTRPILVGIDGGKALHAAVTAVFDHPVVQRCQAHYADLRIIPTLSWMWLGDKGIVLRRSA
jgi:putative transposase